MTDDPWAEFRGQSDAAQDPWAEFRETQSAQSADPQDTTHADTFWGNVAKGYWPTREQALNLVKDAAKREWTGIKETAASVPVLGASVPRDAAMDQYEKDNPAITAINKLGGGAALALPLAAVAPGAVGADASMPWIARTIAGGASNAGISAADTKLRGGSEEDARNNAIVSGLIGMAIPAGGAAVRGAQDAASAYPYTSSIIKNMVSRPIVPWWLGGDLVEGGIGYFTHGLSEPWMVGGRMVGGLIHGIKEGGQKAAQGNLFAPTVTTPTQQQLIRGALIRNTLSNAATQQNQPSQ